MANEIQGPPGLIPELLVPSCVKTSQDVQELLAFMEKFLKLAQENWRREHAQSVPPCDPFTP